MVDVSVRHEPDDTRSVHRILSGPQATVGTTQLPPQSVEASAAFETREGLAVWWSCEGRTREDGS